MKVTYRLGAVSFEKECGTRKDAFDFVGQVQEAFPDEPCAVCLAAGKPGKNTQPKSRKHGENTFREIVCLDCGAALGMVFLDDGRVFPSRQNKDKTPKGVKGWAVWKKDGAANHGDEKPQDDQIVPF